MKIDRYTVKKVNGTDQWFAVAGKKEYPMPDCYKEMYDDRHLAIKEVVLTHPEVMGEGTPGKHYIPLSTE